MMRLYTIWLDKLLQGLFLEAHVQKFAVQTVVACVIKPCHELADEEEEEEEDEEDI